jgi:hypothetical protein
VELLVPVGAGWWSCWCRLVAGVVDVVVHVDEWSRG